MQPFPLKSVNLSTVKELAFLAIGVAIGYALAVVVEEKRRQTNDPNALADSIHDKLEVLEGQLA